MKKLVYLLPVLALAAFAFTTKSVGLEIGKKAPLAEAKMKDISGKSYTLTDLKKDNGLLVIFSCNTCPFVIGWEDKYPELGELTANNNIGMVLVNSNEAKRNGDDSLEAMKEHATKASYNTPYVIDENHKLADAFGAETTPHVFLFNKDMKLVYKGSINDKFEDRDKEASKFYLNDAIGKLVQGEKIDPASTRQIGCTIKRIKA